MKDLLKKVGTLVDETNEVIGALLFGLSVVLHLLKKISQEMMLEGFALAVGVYLGIKTVGGAKALIVALLKKSFGKDEPPKEDGEASGEETG